MLNILLKYQYQYEYQTYETLIANEGENAVLQQFSELERQLKNNPGDWSPRYVLLLDGLNEMPSELQEDLAVELTHIVNEWKNIRIIITGRTVAKYDVFDKFQQIEICGITDSERDAVVSEFNEISGNTELMDILKIPMFLNRYLESHRNVLQHPKLSYPIFYKFFAISGISDNDANLILELVERLKNKSGANCP